MWKKDLILNGLYLINDSGAIELWIFQPSAELVVMQFWNIEASDVLYGG